MMRIALAIAVGGALFATTSLAQTPSPAAKALPKTAETPKKPVADVYKTALECYEDLADLSRIAVAKTVAPELMNSQNARAMRIFQLCAHGKFEDAKRLHDVIVERPEIKREHEKKKGQRVKGGGQAEPKKP